MIGEPVYRREVDLYKKHFCETCTFVNRLGSTETGSIRWYFVDKDTQIDGNIVPVGYPVDDNEILLLDDRGDPVGYREVGEIAVRSRFLSPGYWRKPDRTKDVFLPDPHGGSEQIYRTGDLGRMRPDGLLVCLGRKDFQVKIRGHRIEVDEIEMALLEHPAISEAVVSSRGEDRAGEPRLVAYVVAEGTSTPTVTALRGLLAQHLPDYMIPAAYVKLDALPLAPNGKVNRGALPAPGSERPELETAVTKARNPLERRTSKHLV